MFKPSPSVWSFACILWLHGTICRVRTWGGGGAFNEPLRGWAALCVKVTAPESPFLLEGLLPCPLLCPHEEVNLGSCRLYWIKAFDIIYLFLLHQNSAWSKRLVSRVAVKTDLPWEFLGLEWPKILSHVRISRQPDDLCCSAPSCPGPYSTSYDNFCYYIGKRFGEPLRLLDSGVLKGSRQAMSILYLMLAKKIYQSQSPRGRTPRSIHRITINLLYLFVRFH